MKYNLTELMQNFKQLGGYVDCYGYAWTDEAFDDFDVYGHFASLDMAKLRTYYWLKAQLPNADLKRLRAEFEEIYLPIVNDLDERYLHQQSNYAMAIFYFVKSIRDLNEFGIDFGDEVTKQQLDDLFVSLGGTIKGSVYEIVNKPLMIELIESKIEELNNEIKTIQDPIQKQPAGVIGRTTRKLKTRKLAASSNTPLHKRYQITNITDNRQITAITKIYSKIHELKETLNYEIERHPEYAKLNAVYQAICKMKNLNEYIVANQNIKF